MIKSIYRFSKLNILSLYYRKTTSVCSSSREFFKKLKKKHQQLMKYRDQDIRRYIVGFNQLIANTIIEHRDGVLLPEQLGLIIICTIGKRTQAIDWNRSRELGCIVHHLNEHSEGYGGGLYYTACLPQEGKVRTRRTFTNSEYWYVKPCENMKSMISTAYKKDWKTYWKLPGSKRISEVIDTYDKQMKIKRRQKQLEEGYDEFRFKSLEGIY